VSRDESVSPRFGFPCSSEHRNPPFLLERTSLSALLFLERKMPKQLVESAIKSPFKLMALCFALWFAAHSFFAALFVGFVALRIVKKSLKAASGVEPEAHEAKAPPAPVTAQAVQSVAQPVTPIKRQYAKSAVVVPLKTGTDD